MSRSAAASQLSLSNTDKKPEKGRRVQELTRGLDRKKAHDEEQLRAQRKKDQERWEVEIGGAPVSPLAPLAGEEAVPRHESELPLQGRRTGSQTEVASHSSTESPHGPNSEIRVLKHEVAQLKEELRSTKARLQQLEDEKDEVQKQQREAVSLDAQDEVARLKQRVENLDFLLEQTTRELHRIRGQLHASEDKIDELEEEVRVLRRRKTHEENEALPENETAHSRSPERAQQEKVRKLSSSKKAPSLDERTFTVTVQKRGEKLIKRAKGGIVPFGVR